MGRSHAWVQRGSELVEPRPRNWGDNLTLIGAIRASGWVTTSTWWHATTADRFVTWVRRRLAPKLRTGNIVVMDNLGAHKDSRVEGLIEARGASLHYLPPYGCDLNPMEPGWGFIKKRLRGTAARGQAPVAQMDRAPAFAKAGLKILAVDSVLSAAVCLVAR